MRNAIKSLLFMTTLMVANLSFAQDYGIASYYSDEFHGRKTASGELYNKTKLTGAHKTLRFNTIIRVTRLDNKKSVKIRINDRGPYIKGRIVDVSKAAAKQLGLVNDGEAKVKIEVLGTGQADPEPVITREINQPKPKVKEYTASTAKPVIKNIETGRSTRSKTGSATKTKKAADEYVAKAPQAKKVETKMRTDRGNYKTFDLYKVQVLRPEREGYGVQVASYTNYENVLKQVAELQEKWFNNILVSVEKGKDNNPVYKIMLGPFPDENTAKSYKKQLKKKKRITGFLVNLADIKY